MTRVGRKFNDEYPYKRKKKGKSQRDGRGGGNVAIRVKMGAIQL